MGLGDFLGGIFGSHTTTVDPIIKAQQIGLDQGDLAAQKQYLSQVQGLANGTGPSLASQMLTNNADTTAGNAVGLAASQRGVNPGLAMKQALDAGNQARAQAGQQAATARVGEQLGALGQLGSQVNTMQGQNVGVQAANQNADLQASGINAGIATGNTATNNKVTGGVMSGLGSMFGMGASGKAHGGFIHKPFAQYLANGGFASMGTAPGAVNPYTGAFNFSGLRKLIPAANPVTGADAQTLAGGPMDAIGGAVDAAGPLAMMASKGGQVPGQAQVKGDSKKNDIVPTMLSPEELVIPRSVSTSPGFIKKLESMVKDMPGKGPQGFAKVLAARKGRAS